MIDGDGAFTAANGVTQGTGTAADPYVIEGWEIDASTAVGIDIRNTTAHFLLRNVFVHSASPTTYYHGIQLTSASNGVLSNITASIASAAGINVFRGANLTILGADVMDSRGLWVDTAANITISGNRLGETSLVFVDGASITNNTFDRYNMIASWTSDSRNVSFVTNTDFGVIGQFRFERVDGVQVADLQAPQGSLILLSSGNTTARGNELDDLYAEFMSGLVLTTNRMGNATIQSSYGASVSSNTILGRLDVVSSDAARIDNNTFPPGASGIRVSGSRSASISGNTLAGGILLLGTAPADFDSHTITTDNLVGGQPVYYYARCLDVVHDGLAAAQVLIASCRNVRVANVSTMNAAPGVMLAFVQNATVESNNISAASGDGIVTWTSANLTVSRNNVTDSGRGFVAHGSTSIRLFMNDFVGAHGYQAETGGGYIGLGVSLDQVDDVRVFHNRFIANEEQAGGYGTSVQWDDGYPGGGNWWSDYRMHDTCSGPNQDVCPDPDGFGDVPYTTIWGANDRYPQGPPNTPPVAQFWTDPVGPIVNEHVWFHTYTSFDSDGEIMEARLDYGDGQVQTSRYASTFMHDYATAGTYTVTLTVVDDSGAPGTLSKQLLVSSPLDRPVASFTVSPWMPLVGSPAVLDASSSRDPLGRTLTYDWFLSGLNDRREGVQVNYTFTFPYPQMVYLKVTNDVGLFDELRAEVWVVEAPPTLTTFEHTDGRFRVPVPQGWELDVNVSVPPTVVELVVVRDTFQYPPNAIAVETDVDPNVREDSGYLLSVANATIQALRDQYLFITVHEEPVVGPIASHLGVVFEVRTSYGIEAYAIVVSEAHGRFWILGLSARDEEYPGMRGLFDVMIDGFEILPPLSSPPTPPPGGSAGTPPWILAIGLLAVAAAVVAILVALLRRSRRHGETIVPRRFCADCGSPMPAGAGTVCPVCGSAGGEFH